MLFRSHKAYAWTDNGYRKFVIVEYKIKNEADTTLNNLFAGIFADWDIMDYSKNKASFNATKNLGYAYSTETAGIWAGVKLLTPGMATCYSIDNVTGGGGGINMYDGFSEDEKTFFSSANIIRFNARLSSFGEGKKKP